MKKCSACKIEKPREDFGKNATHRDGLQSECKECRKASRNVLDPRTGRTRHHESVRKSIRENLSSYLVSRAKFRANRDGLEFNISEADITVPARCPVLDIPIEHGVGRPCRGSPTIDKIIPSLGYVKGNVQVVSWLANAMKRDATPEELISFAYWVLATFNNNLQDIPDFKGSSTFFQEQIATQEKLATLRKINANLRASIQATLKAASEFDGEQEMDPFVYLHWALEELEEG